MLTRLRAFGLEVRVPERDEIDDIHRVIYDELCAGIVKDESRDRYRQIILRMADQGSEAVILGCTEITMLIAPKDVPVPTFDTTAIHAEDAAEFIIGARSS